MPGRMNIDRENGASLVEFALLISLIVLVAFVAVQFAGSETSQMWSDIQSAVGSASN